MAKKRNLEDVVVDDTGNNSANFNEEIEEGSESRMEPTTPNDRPYKDIFDHKDYWEKKSLEWFDLFMELDEADGDKAAERKAMLEFLEKTPFVVDKLKIDLRTFPQGASLVAPSRYFSRTAMAAEKASTALCTLGALSQAESFSVTRTAKTKPSDTNTNIKGSNNDTGGTPKLVPLASKLLSCLLGDGIVLPKTVQEKNDKDDKLKSFGRVSFASIFSEEQLNRKRVWSDELAKVSNMYQKLAMCKKLDQPTSQEDEAKYANDIKYTVSHLKESTTKQSRFCNESFKFPGPISMEKDGVQPIFQGLLEGIISSVEQAIYAPAREAPVVAVGLAPTKSGIGQEGTDEQEDSATDDHMVHNKGSSSWSKASKGPLASEHDISPPKTNVVNEVVVEGFVLPSSIHRKKRCADFALTKRGSFVHLYRDDGMEVLMEVKPGCRRQTGPIGLLKESRQQALSHLAKNVFQGLLFAEAGVATYATAVIGSLSFVEVLRLELFDPGTPDSRLRLFSTGPLPLMTKKVYNQWYESKATTLSRAQKDQVEEFGNDLYRSRDVEDGGVPLGIKALAICVASKRKSLFGQPWSNLTNNQLGRLIGSGAFGMVFERNDFENSVVKVSRFGRKDLIQREVQILHFLKGKIVETSFENESLPEFQQWGDLRVEIGNVQFLTPYLQVSPRGRPFVSFQRWSTQAIQAVYRDIQKALHFVHQHGVFHGDVNDRNVVLKECMKKRQLNAVLIDFGNAKVLGQKMNGFHGTPSFAHSDIHQKRTWYCEAVYDFASLGFTLVTMLNGCVVPWTGFSSKPVLDDSMFKDRSEKSTAILKEHSKIWEDPSQGGKIVEWLNAAITPETKRTQFKLTLDMPTKVQL